MHDGTRALHDETFGFVAPRRVGTVGAVEELLVGQFLTQRFQNGKPAQAGVENADRIACRRHDGLRLGLVGCGTAETVIDGSPCGDCADPV